MAVQRGVSITTSDALVRKLWQFCNVLRDDGLSYPDYVEQLTYLIFLKMTSEGMGDAIPTHLSWESLCAAPLGEIASQYERVLKELSASPGILALIFDDARNKVSDPAKLRLLMDQLIGSIDWSSLPLDVKGDAYEGLLEKNSRDTKSGAGQYFTPRPLVDAMIACLQPKLGETLCDPACGTGGFLLSANAYLHKKYPKLTKKQAASLRGDAFLGVELVRDVARLAAMNMYLHGLTGEGSGRLPVQRGDSLESVPTERFDLILTNPPFGIKGSVTYTGGNGRAVRSAEELRVVRPDFTIQTSNKQLNFMQHILSMLKPRGRSAVVVPDNVLFDSGSAAHLRSRLTSEATLIALLRLPTGIFYAQGVRSSVLFFRKGRPRSKQDRGIWTYDLRSGKRFSVKSRPLRAEDLEDFVQCFLQTPEGSLDRAHETPRWQVHHESDIASSGGDLSGLWRTDAPTPDVPPRERIASLSSQVTSDLEEALSLIRRATEGIS